MTTITLTNRISLSTDRAESCYGIPVLVIDGQAFGPNDLYGPAIRAALDNPSDPLNWLNDQYSGIQLLLSLCTTEEAKDVLRAFCPTNWTSPNGEADARMGSLR